VLKASATGLIAQTELDLLRKMMPDNEYLQEFECDFDAAITGAYFAKGLNDAEFDGRITRVPYDKALRVITFWDLGMADSMCIWFLQVWARRYASLTTTRRVAMASTTTPRSWKARMASDKPERWAPRAQYHYGKHYGPHDIMVRELGTGKSRWEVADGLGITFDVAPNIPVKDGIDAVRMVMNRMWWDKEKTEQGRDALKQYQEKWDEKRNVSLGPLHNWASHAADAMRIGIVALEEPNLKTKEQEDQMGHYQGAGGWMR
jgi:phage terminase large subunit